MADKPPSRAELETKIAQLQLALDVERGRRSSAESDARAAQGREAETRAAFTDLKERLALAESANQRMRGYILRVQEDDVVREELVVTGEPGGEQQLAPKRKHERFDAPMPYMIAGGSDGCSSVMYRESRDRPKPKHWVNY